jgi:hypothetical protein
VRHYGALPYECRRARMARRPFPFIGSIFKSFISLESKHKSVRQAVGLASATHDSGAVRSISDVVVFSIRVKHGVIFFLINSYEMEHSSSLLKRFCGLQPQIFWIRDVNKVIHPITVFKPVPFFDSFAVHSNGFN